MSNEPRPAVRSPLMREFVAVVVIAVAVVVWVPLLFVFSNRRLVEGKREDGRRVGAILVAIITKEMREHAAHRVQRHLEEIPLGADLVSVRVFESSGTLVYAVGDEGLGRRVDRGTDALCRDCHGPGRTPALSRTSRSAEGLPSFWMDVPIPNGPECVACHGGASRHLGNLLIETTFTPLERSQARRRTALILAGGVTILAAVVLLGVLLQTRVLGPLRALYDAVQRARAGDVEARAPVRREDEIGFLARSFNQTMDLTRRHQSELEQQVAARTAELERSRTEAIHRESLAAAGRLAAGMAHEIGNPLSAISTTCQFVRRRRRDDAFVSEQLELVESHVRRLSDLTAQMMDLARPSPPERTRLDVNDLVATACSLARMDRRLAGRELTVRLSAELPPVLAHPDVVSQAVINLLLNAADASPESRSITVTTATEAGQVVVRVRDEGGGVPPALERTIFQPFFTTKSPDRGSGLGLSVSLSLLQSVGGDLTLHNDPGRGATFVIVLQPADGE